MMFLFRRLMMNDYVLVQVVNDDVLVQEFDVDVLVQVTVSGG